jgi:hypothetical protein
MKKLVSLLPLAIMCAISAWILAFTVSMANSPNPPDDAVGHPNEGAPPTVYINELVDEFEDGGDITVFQIVNLSGNWKLLRKGFQNGKKRTEVVPIALSGGYFRFAGPVWYVVCDLSAQDCPSPGFCDPNSSNTACVCNGSSPTCNFGGSPGQLFPTEVLK